VTSKKPDEPGVTSPLAPFSGDPPPRPGIPDFSEIEEQARLRQLTRDLAALRQDVADLGMQRDSIHDRLSSQISDLASWQARSHDSVASLVRRTPHHDLSLGSTYSLLQGTDAMRAQEVELERWIASVSPQHDRSESPTERLKSLIDTYPMVRLIVRERLLLRVVAEISANTNEHSELLHKLWEGMPGVPPERFTPGTVAELPAALRLEVENRWALLCVGRWCELNYGPLVPELFRRRAASLERVVYRCIELDDPLAADELLLQLNEDDSMMAGRLANTAVTAVARAALIGPVPLAEVDPPLNQALEALAPGQFSSVLQLDDGYVVLKLEARAPAVLDDDQYRALLEAMLEEDLEAVLHGCRPPHAWRLGTIGE